MNSIDSLAADCHSREVRLGLVMYGGVSLAVYIYGVTNEFFRAVRGRGVYRLIKALTDSDIVVDVVSGTSAGGINGILLAYCLTNQLEFGAAAEMWRRDGGIDLFLQDPTDLEVSSLLQGDAYFRSKLKDAFLDLLRHRIPRTGAGEDPSVPSEVDLFVTATDIEGKEETHLDSAGHAIDVKDHRVVFHLKHRKGRKEPFHPDWQDSFLPKVPANAEELAGALAKLARCTSSFPVAFEPVCLGKEEKDRSIDERLKLWAWGPAGAPDKPVYLVDGGVLDNKPFTLSIREIFYRLSEVNVDRKLFYVEPDPEVFSKEARPGGRKGGSPDAFGVAVASLSTIPSYESIGDDLRSLTEHNVRVARLQRLTAHLQGAEGVDSSYVDDRSRAFMERWRSWERGGDIPTPKANDGVPSPYAHCRLVALSERVVNGILRDRSGRVLVKEKDRTAAEALVRAFDEWPGSGDFTLYHLDVHFRLRRLFHLLYACPDPEPGERKDVERVRRTLNRQAQLLELLRNAMERLLDEGEFSWRPAGGTSASSPRDLWTEQVVPALFYLLDNGPQSSPTLLPAPYEPESLDGEESGQAWLQRVHEELKRRLGMAKAALADGHVRQLRPERFRSVLLATDAYERALMGNSVGRQACQVVASGVHPDSGSELSQEYDRFLLIDAVTFPLRSVSGLEEQDIIETVRISPRDAQEGFSHRLPADKLGGDALAHFSGFLKRSWRSNDILWGRLDGTCQLVETLLDSKRIQDVVSVPPLRAKLRAAIGADLSPKKLFEHLPRPSADRLRVWLQNLVSEDAGKRSAAIHELDDGKTPSAANKDTIRALLIEAAQLEVLHEEVGNVVEDAIEDQKDWNQFRVLSGGRPATNDSTAPKKASHDPIDPGSLAFHSGSEVFVDPLVGDAATAELARRTLDRIGKDGGGDADGPRNTPMGRFFLRKYRVGEESIDQDIPLPVLVSLAARTLLVLRNCVGTVLQGRLGAQVRESGLYRFTGVVLRALRGIAVVMNVGPRATVAAGACLLVASLLALAVSIVWPDPILWSGGQLSWRRAGVFVGLPSLALLFLGFLLWRLGTRGIGRGETVLPFHPLGFAVRHWGRGMLLFSFGSMLCTGAITVALAWDRPWTQSSLLHAGSIGDMPAATLRVVLSWDFAFLGAYSLFLSVFALRLAQAWRPQACGGRIALVALAWLALACGLADAIENLALWRLAAGDSSWVASGLLASSCKCFPPLALLGILLASGLGLLVWNASRPIFLPLRGPQRAAATSRARS